MMILKEIFQQHGYHDLLITPGEFNLDYLYDATPDGSLVKPRELLFLYISKHGDELFPVLDREQWFGDIESLCDKWDNNLSAFCNFGSASKKTLHKFTYNMVQVILIHRTSDSRSVESSLHTARKILLPYKDSTSGQINIDASNAILLPFYLGQIETAHDNTALKEKLIQHLPPKDNDCYTILSTQHKTPQKKNNAEILPKTYSDEEREKIKGWFDTLC